MKTNVWPYQGRLVLPIIRILHRMMGHGIALYEADVAEPRSRLLFRPLVRLITSHLPSRPQAKTVEKQTERESAHDEMEGWS